MREGRLPDPPPWPGHPDEAEPLGPIWHVTELPPLPYPADDYDYGNDPRFGPPQTLWTFKWDDLADRETAPGASDATRAAVRRLLRKWKARLPDFGTTQWVTPFGVAAPATPVEVELYMPMDWIRTAVSGTIGTDEQFVHVLNWRHSTQENAPIDAATLKLVGDKVRDGFVAFLGASGNVQGINTVFPTTVTYREVRTSHLHQEAPAGKPDWVGSTQVSPFTTGNVGTGTEQSLPYEVAMGVSLNTNFRGTSRFRGRLYLGPLTVKCMGTLGQFQATVVDGIGAAFGTAVIAGVETATDYELHVVSQKYGTSAKVTGVRMGETPDSQRRRRRNRPESYAQVWGTPVGAL